MTDCNECGSDRTSVIPHADENVKCVACGAKYQDDDAERTPREMWASESQTQSESQSQEQQSTLGRFGA